MPSPSVWMIRLSVLYLIFSGLTGMLILMHKAIYLHPGVWALLPVHFEMAIWGWLVQFVMGTAYWMFPRYLKDQGRGHSAPAWLMVFLLNSGIIFLIGTHLQFLFDGMFLVSRSCIGIAVLFFIYLMWKRITTYRHIQDV